MPPVLINGQYGDSISVQDRGLNYGDGIFETIAVVNSQPLLWKQHLHRLRLGCKRLKIFALNWQQLQSEIATLLVNQSNCVLKILITRGCGGRGYKITESVITPNRILSLHPLPQYPKSWWETGIQARLCHTKLAINPALAGIKHTNRLEQILASTEWNDPNIAEGLMQDTNDNWICGTKTNLFLIKDNTLLTPTLYNSGVKGVMRSVVIQQAKLHGIKVIQRNINIVDIKQANNIFVTNSIIGIWPIKKLNGKMYSILMPLSFKFLYSDAIQKNKQCCKII
jgi:4-amino-4-deoxychorismate lyase